MLKKYFITKHISVTILCSIIVTITIYRTINLVRHYRIDKENGLYCYYTKNESLKQISNKSIFKDGRSIFFIDASCKSSEKNRIFLSPKQACAVESAARIHPNWNVYVLFTAPAVIKFTGKHPNEIIIKTLLEYKNVHFLHLNFNNFVAKREFLAVRLFNNGKGRLETSTYAYIHSSYYLRLFTLLKYGGIYLDLDVITLKKFDNLFLNFAGLQSDFSVGNDVLRISPNNKELPEKLLWHMQNSYQSHLYQYNGPGVLTRMLKSICNITYIPDLIHCHPFKIYQQEMFYPISYEDWPMFFNSKKINFLQNKIKDSYTIKTYHVGSIDNIVGDKPYGLLTKTYCPSIFNASGGIVL